jgi:hypothetical protein
MRGKDYSGPMLRFAETAMFHPAGSTDKLAARWVEGIYVGKIVETDEFLYLTENGTKSSRSVKRLPESEACDTAFLKTVKGSPWNATGKAQEGVVEGTALMPGNRVRRMCITSSMLDKHGRAPGCSACAGLPGVVRSEACRTRIEMCCVQAGGATDLADVDKMAGKRKE